MCLIVLAATGCVQSEIADGSGKKMKTATVWNSDLRLTYDDVYKREGRTNKPYDYGEDYEEYEERIITLHKEKEEIEEALEVKEVNSEEIDKLIAEQVGLKIEEDESKSKAPEQVLEIENKDKPYRWKWLLLVAASTTLGGFYTSTKKKKKKK